MTTDMPHTTIKVFRDSAEWDKHEKWWQMPPRLIRELFVCMYDLVLEEDGDPVDPLGALRFVQEEHPNCVFVY